MKRLVVLLVAFLVTVTGVQSRELKGSAEYVDAGIAQVLEFVLIYDEKQGNGTLSWRKAAPAKGGKIPPAAEWIKRPFTATRKGAIQGGRSLIGFAIDKGYPVTLIVDVWKKEKKTFKFYDTFFTSGQVIKGFIK